MSGNTGNSGNPVPVTVPGAVTETRAVNGNSGSQNNTTRTGAKTENNGNPVIVPFTNPINAKAAFQAKARKNARNNNNNNNNNNNKNGNGNGAETPFVPSPLVGQTAIRELTVVANNTNNAVKDFTNTHLDSLITLATQTIGKEKLITLLESKLDELKKTNSTTNSTNNQEKITGGKKKRSTKRKSSSKKVKKSKSKKSLRK